MDALKVPLDLFASQKAKGGIHAKMLQPFVISSIVCT